MDSFTQDNERAVIGGNAPPLVDPDLLAQCKGRVDEFAAKTREWLDLGEIANADQASRLADFITGARKVSKVIDEARVKAKKPHDDAGKAVQAIFTPLLDTLTKLADRVKPMQAAWLRKDQARLDAEKAAQEARAAALRLEAEAASLLAQASNNVAAEVEAEALAKQAADLEKAANRDVRAKVESASGAGRTMSTRVNRRAQITNIRLLFLHYQNRPEVAEVLERLANADIRARDVDETLIPGISIIDMEQAA